MRCNVGLLKGYGVMGTTFASAIASTKVEDTLTRLWKPHDYQQKAVEFLLGREAAALFLDPGLGKTSISYAACKILKDAGLFKGALVVAPLRPVYSVWPAEREKWVNFADFSVGILHGPRKDAVLREKHDIYVINYEGLQWLFGELPPKKPSTYLMSPADTSEITDRYVKAYSEWASEAVGYTARRKALFANVDTLICDELPRLKNPNSARFKSVRPYLPLFYRRWGLTGSPAANGLLDLFGQCYVLDLGAALGKYVTHYRAKYFTSAGFKSMEWTLQKGAEERIYEALAPLALRMAAEDYLTMPKVVENVIYVELPAKARAFYEKIEDDLFAVIDDKAFEAATAASVCIKCRQIASGALYDTPQVDDESGIPLAGPRTWTLLHDEKLTALADLVEDLQGQQLLVAYHWGHDLDRIAKKLGKLAEHTAHAASKVEALRIAWNAGKIRVLTGHPASIGHGLNLQEGGARHIAFFTPDWNLEYREQFVARLKRQGTAADTIFVHTIVARDTIDHAVMGALASKHKGQQALFAALRDYRDK